MNQVVREFLKINGYTGSLGQFPSCGEVGGFAELEEFIRSHNGAPRVQSNLSFEVNLDEELNVTKKMAKLSKRQKKKPSKKQSKKGIPPDFIAHIVKLGFDAKDAPRLYESKNDWLGLSSDGRVLCTERGCKFSSPLSSDALFEHCRTVHGWGDHPCTHGDCAYIAYSVVSLKQHLAKFHSPYKTHNGNFPCSFPGCKAVFSINVHVHRHERVHNNDISKCIFCPYVNVSQWELIKHQRMHFNTRNFVCDVCQKAFTTGTMLNDHKVRTHELGETTLCPLCDKEDIKCRIVQHLYHKHKVKGAQWDDKQKQYIVPKQV